MTVYGASASRDRQGWVFGLTGPQFFFVLATGLPVWATIVAGRWVALVGVLPVWIGAVLLICVPMRGWSAVQWIGVLIRHSLGVGFGWSRFEALAATGDLEHGDGMGSQADLPGVLNGIRIHDGPPMSGQTARPAVIQNQANRTWAATARIVHPGIGMSDAADRFGMGAGLTELCEAATAGQQISFLALQVRSIPDDGTERADWVRRNRQDSEPEVSARVNHQLESMTAGAAVRREAFVTVVVREEVISKEARRAGPGVTGRARILYSVLIEVEAHLLGAMGCTKVEWLDSSELAIAIRTGFEPGDAPALAAAKIDRSWESGEPAAIPIEASGPVRASTTMRAYRHGEWASSASTILLPRKGARMGALARAVVPSHPGERRSLTVFYQPLSQQSAARATNRAQMSAQMASTIRSKVGQEDRASDRRLAGGLQLREEKLDAGRSLAKVSAVASVTVPAAWNAQDFARRLDASIRTCGFTPLALDGAHDAAFAVSSIPLGAVLPKGR